MKKVELWILTDGSRIYWTDDDMTRCLNVKLHDYPKRDDLKVIKLSGIYK